MTPEYMAGFVDGEGWIGLTGRRYPQVTISNTNREVLDQIAAAYGGKVYVHVQRHPRWKDQWHWAVSGSPAMALVETIQPFLIVKKEQAAAVLRLRDAGGTSGKTPSADVVALRREVHGQLAALNRKGRAA